MRRRSARYACQATTTPHSCTHMCTSSFPLRRRNGSRVKSMSYTLLSTAKERKVAKVWGRRVAKVKGRRGPMGIKRQGSKGQDMHKSFKVGMSKETHKDLTVRAGRAMGHRGKAKGSSRGRHRDHSMKGSTFRQHLTPPKERGQRGSQGRVKLRLNRLGKATHIQGKRSMIKNGARFMEGKGKGKHRGRARSMEGRKKGRHKD
ncbi:hypothetical protein DUNSADRAFT_16886 [Dunaliella salina]|uniref:Encoded protein n=1 Tax=Dunaliella salina TaxID=3046 RepID=A0ABQ7H962_DUNSA|nr:hypothetical protein DUNSADRAFT_16886 [Dunaliella salina]|eukprot:KAF5843387.1 hypothetical protein DUNSADRAFT_16886 [Dunaliella salina]